MDEHPNDLEHTLAKVSDNVRGQFATDFVNILTHVLPGIESQEF